MRLPLYQIDAFTSRVFRGNPAAVVVLEHWLPDSVLAAIAAENNLPETAFFLDAGEEMPLRWFTSTVEVDLCGHATLAAAHVVFERRPALQRATFSTRSGELSVTREGEFLSMDFPSRPGRRVAHDGAIASALGAVPREALLARDLLAVLDSEEAVRGFQPDADRLASLDVFGVIISAPGETVDYVYRFFAPRQGIPEDPATGSANCTLVPYWSARLGKTELAARQLSARGGELRCASRDGRVAIAGRTALYLRGEISV